MNPADQINLQRQIKESTEEVQNQIKELYDWEKRMKEKERKAKESKQEENVPNNKYPPVRSQIDHESHKLLKENVKESQWKTKGDQFKNQGNEMLKNGEYEKAALLYTKAIKLYEKEPIYYSNRSLCYLKLQRFIEAISDCDSALKLDDKFVKAYYRRMQARENLGFIAEALQDCQTILNLDPKNAEAQQSLKKLEALVSSDKNKVSEINLPDNESEKLSNENIKENEVKIRADEFKVKGNDAMKKGAFESAVSLYTEAIKVFDKEPIYYSNRSLCFIKLEKFDEAITDCDKAIELDDKFVKAYYRRMQANECLGLAKRALEDCTKVLEIDPKNTEAKASFQRINQRIKRYDKSKVLPPLQSNEDYITPTFTKPSETLIKIEPIEKPAHLRSKKPLKRIDINEFIEAKTTANYSNIQVSDEIIDYLFNTGECGSFVKEEPKKPKLDINATPEPAAKLSPTQTPATPTESVEETSNSKTKKTETYVYSTVIFLVIALILGYYFQPQQKQLPKATQSKSQISSTSSYRLPEMPPKSTAEFHANWKDLSLENKFKYLKSIEIQKLTNILGTGFESVHLTEILSILSTFYVEEKLEPQKVLREICKHENIGILALFMDGKDKDALSKVLSYVKSTQDPGELIKIQETFNISV